MIEETMWENEYVCEVGDEEEEEEGGKKEEEEDEEEEEYRVEISDEIRATVIDHVLVHGLTMREAGLRVQPNLSRFSVPTIVRTFREEQVQYTTVFL